MTKDTKKDGNVRALAALLSTLLAGGALLCPASAQPQQRSGVRPAKRAPAQQRAATAGPDRLYSRGFFLYENNDTSDGAAAYFEDVIGSYPDSPEAERAQFFLGGYYQRKYQIKSSRSPSETDSETLVKAREAYETYLRRYPQGGPCQCLSDAHFNLALVYLQLGNSGAARAHLLRLQESHAADPAVYIYQVTWSESQREVIDSHFDARRLGEYAYGIAGLRFEDATALLKKWCRNEKSRQSHGS